MAIEEMSVDTECETDITLNNEQKNNKEAIHSGQFMVSQFEAEEGGDELDAAYVGNSEDTIEEIQGVKGVNRRGVITFAKPAKDNEVDTTTVSIDSTLAKLFCAMTMAYRQNITCPKWNCFKGIKLRWKEKIRLNNVIWRCWHMQYIQKKKMTICQFELEVDEDVRPEMVLLEGKYWKRNTSLILTEYQKWRENEKRRLTGIGPVNLDDGLDYLNFEDMDYTSLFLKSSFNFDYLSDAFDFTDMLFSSTDTPQTFQIPDPREIARSVANSDLLQPGLVQLQPSICTSLDCHMFDIQEMLAGRTLPTVPEEDVLTEVEDTVALPTPSSPPSVSTPVPAERPSLQDCRFTSLPDVSLYSNYPSSPQLYSPQESFIPNSRDLSSSSTGVSLMSSSLPSIRVSSITSPTLPVSGATHHTHNHHRSTSFDSGRFLAPTIAHTGSFAQVNRESSASKSASVPCNLNRQTFFISPTPDEKASSVPSGLHTQTIFLSTPPSPDAHKPSSNPVQLIPQESSQAILVSPNATTSFTPIQPAVAVVSTGNACPSSSAWGPQSSVVAPVADHHTFVVPKIYAKSPLSSTSQRGSTSPLSPIYFSSSSPASHDTTTLSQSAPGSPAISVLHPKEHGASQQLVSESVFLSQLITPGANASSNGGVLVGPQGGNKLRGSTPGQAWETTVGSFQQQQQQQQQPTYSVSSREYPVSSLALASTGKSAPKLPVLSHVSLSPVLPSSVKTIRPPVSILAPNVSIASMGHLLGSLGSVISFKGSPPEPDSPRSPLYSRSSTSPPIKPFRPKNDTERIQYKEHRRVSHINAEQKRRCNIKNNFDLLHSLVVPVVATGGGHNPHAKISKAMMLHKGAEYIVATKQERISLSEKAEKMRSEIEALSADISQAQSLLPATGAPISHNRHNKVKEKFELYMRDRALQDPKYFIMGMIAQPLLESFNSSVSTTSVEDLCRSAFVWLDQHCNLNVMRPVVSNVMRKLSVSTNILIQPESLTEEIFHQITKREDISTDQRRDSSSGGCPLLLEQKDGSVL